MEGKLSVSLFLLGSSSLLTWSVSDVRSPSLLNKKQSAWNGRDLSPCNILHIQGPAAGVRGPEGFHTHRAQRVWSTLVEQHHGPPSTDKSASLSAMTVVTWMRNGAQRARPSESSRLAHQQHPHDAKVRRRSALLHLLLLLWSLLCLRGAGSQPGWLPAKPYRGPRRINPAPGPSWGVWPDHHLKLPRVFTGPKPGTPNNS